MNTEKEACGNCRFAGSHGADAVRLCKRHAPVPIERLDMPGALASKWPPVFVSDWCGDYEATLSTPKTEGWA